MATTGQPPQMTKEEYADLLTEIAGEEVLGIEGKVIGFSLRQERADAERATFERHDSEFWALLHLGDAIHQFYRDTLDLVGKSMTPGMAGALAGVGAAIIADPHRDGNVLASLKDCSPGSASPSRPR